MRILIASSEVAPFAKTGGLADVSGALPKALKNLGHEVGVIMPMYRGIHPDEPALASLDASVAYENRWSAIYRKWLAPDLPVFLVDHRHYYDRESIYCGNNGDYWDNAARFAYFSRVVCEFARKFLPELDVIHLNDWQTSMVPVFMRTHYALDPVFYGTGTLLTVHNMGYQGVFGKEAMDVLELPWKYFTRDCLEFNDSVNFLKGGIVFADVINTVSRRYSFEIQTPEYGYGLEGLLRHRSADLFGVLNGVDYNEWNPATDPHIHSRYSSVDLSGKRECKRALLAECGLYSDYHGPVIGIISRLAGQKGFDLVAEIAYHLMQLDCALVVLGSGEPQYESLFHHLASLYPHKVGVRLAYDAPLAHRIEAGIDMLLMPSKYEPCGLNQIYSLKYGSIPIVRATGGLDDTIEDYDYGSDTGTGFKFYRYEAADLLNCIYRALATYQDSWRWHGLVQRAMSRHYSWDDSARQYELLYQRAKEQHVSFMG
ncbi:MAG: glycogen synthase GlgA [Acidobacteria bacterium]|nr:glycogen synthase GlgA [Acidobacteriota bacterium]